MKNLIWILVFLVLGSMPFVFVGVLLENKIAIVGVGVFCVVTFYVMLAGMIQEEIQHDKNHPELGIAADGPLALDNQYKRALAALRGPGK